MLSPSDRDDRRGTTRRAATRHRRPASPRIWTRGRSSVSALALVSLALVTACPTPEAAVTSPSSASGGDDSSAASPKRKKPPREVHTANPDRRTFENQPDYDGDAASLREYMDPRMPAPAPTDRGAACAAMFAAADTFYASVETDPKRAAEVAANLKATRSDDLDACVRETSAQAATCVKILLGDRTAEFAWLIDQCSRAYPAGA